MGVGARRGDAAWNKALRWVLGARPHGSFFDTVDITPSTSGVERISP